MLDYIINLYSILYKKFDLEKIGITGGSQGGAGERKEVTEFEKWQYYNTLVTLNTPRLEMTKSLG